MHSHFRKTAEKLLGQKPSDLVTLDAVKNLQHCLRLALLDNDQLAAGVEINTGNDCLTFADLDAMMLEIQDMDLQKLLRLKIGRWLSNKQGVNVMETKA
jgi:hypothetical protein